MSLVKDLQQQRLLGPLARRFTLSEWVKQGTRPDLLEGESEVIALGALFNASLSTLRGLLRLVNRDDLATSSKRTLLVALANRECLLAEVIIIERLTARVPKGSLVSMDQLAAETISLLGGEFRPDEIAETTVDAAERLIKMCPLNEEEPPTEDALPPLEEARQDMNIAASYLSVESLWMDVVWNGFRVDRGQPPLTLAPIDSGPEAFEAISRHRHMMTTTHSHSSAFAQSRRAPAPRYEVRPLTIAARVENGRAELSNVEASDDQLSRRVANRTSGLPPYYASIWDRAAPEHATLTLGLVVDAFNVLAEMANDLAVEPLKSLRLELARRDDLIAESPALAPSISRPQLQAALAAALGVSAELANEVVRFFTFEDLASEVASAPLVSLGANRMVAMVNPLRSGNLRWMADRWLRRLGFPLDFRGAEFEQYARGVLVSDAKASTLARVSTVHPTAFEFVTEAGRTEEIDILAVVNDLVLVGEAKCFLEPVAPIERRNHREKISEAVSQVQRKAEAVRGSRTAFMQRAKQLGFPVPEQYRVAPLVVLNHALGAGQVIDGVPVVDLSIYSLFFKGSMQWMAVLDAAGNIESGLVEYFYSRPDAAAASLEAYLANPPQVRHLRATVAPRRCGRLFPALSAGVIYSIELDVDPSRVNVPGAVPFGKIPRGTPGKRGVSRRKKRRGRSRRR